MYATSSAAARRGSLESARPPAAFVRCGSPRQNIATVRRPNVRRTTRIQRSTVLSRAASPATTIRLGSRVSSASPIPSIPWTGTDTHSKPARTRHSSRALTRGRAGSRKLDVASAITMFWGRQGDGARRRARESHSAAHAMPKPSAALESPKLCLVASTPGSRKDSTRSSTVRTVSSAATAESACSALSDAHAPISRSRSDFLESRALATALEIASPSCKASRSATISSDVNSRCRPGDRTGLGNPNLCSHALRVLGLTFRSAAASDVFSARTC